MNGRTHELFPPPALPPYGPLWRKYLGLWGLFALRDLENIFEM